MTLDPWRNNFFFLLGLISDDSVLKFHAAPLNTARHWLSPIRQVKFRSVNNELAGATSGGSKTVLVGVVWFKLVGGSRLTGLFKLTRTPEEPPSAKSGELIEFGALMPVVFSDFFLVVS